MKQSYIYVDVDTGQIIARTRGWKDEELAASYQCVASDAEPDLHYYRNNQVQAKREMEPTVVGRTISFLPGLCTAIINGQEFEVSGGELEVDAPSELPLEVRIEAVEFFPWSTTL